MIAKTEQHHFAGGERLGLVDRVAVPFLLVLNRKLHARRQIAHLLGLGEQGGIFHQPLEIFRIRAGKIVADRLLVARLDDDADLLDARGDEIDQVIMNQRPRNSVRADDREQFLLHRMRGRKMPRPQSRGGNDGFANAKLFAGFHFGANHTAGRFANPLASAVIYKLHLWHV